MKRPDSPSRRLRETRRRSVAKAVIYRILIIIVDVVIIYWVTHGIAQTILLTIVTNIASTVLYYGHERAWNAVRWGLVKAR
jgi:uncharacterized membrane protein